MFETIQDIINTIIAISGIFYVSKIYHQSRHDHPVFHYDQHSSPNQADWRWRKPDAKLGLTLKDDEQKSCLQIPLHPLTFEKVCISVGYVCAAFTLVIYGMLIIRNAGWPEYLSGLIFIILTLALINVGNRVSSITLYPDHLRIVENYGFILKRILIYKRQPGLEFTGKLQSWFELTLNHTEPDFNLYIKRRYCFIFPLQRKLLLSLNQSQGSWVGGGLGILARTGGIT